MTSHEPKRPHPFYATRWLPWTLFALSALIGFVLLITTVAVATSKSSSTAAPARAVPAPTVTVPAPAETVTVSNASEVRALKKQLRLCNDAWLDIAKRENRALVKYNEATKSIVRAVQESDVSGLNDATAGIQDASDIVEKATPLVSEANATCTAD